MIIVERDVRRLELLVRIPREDFERALTSESEFNALIAEISKMIYKEGMKE